jgi:hypothetical protein
VGTGITGHRPRPAEISTLRIWQENHNTYGKQSFIFLKTMYAGFHSDCSLDDTNPGLRFGDLPHRGQA